MTSISTVHTQCFVVFTMQNGHVTLRCLSCYINGHFSVREVFIFKTRLSNVSIVPLPENRWYGLGRIDNKTLQL